ncbi:radical SAM family heme chaperone HemW [Mobiluncus curtisii]|uniref:Heme chaperone HemW n=1 Tax=Mobiluncus curtisii TaxID=2051 RepID=A0A7Y0YCP2_9ACTO|nr:radical SAM family heme chaperone HemW [Mobiluncus curtisii]EFL94080.1 putative oxygen-independent coproporphyrinogen III oxidase [Mobiluncus curtisii subsp. curtisii ATCC 35241]MCU9987613.1 radical SAM family heme chaperone HemW [Mobiluncus curtisii]MCV0000705.1 radical SAM family heme chaperone HemW [Mobiluncus curtisii]NMW48530.1 radical SAM family heme chaperone HemW [Mobiluncus curtisii]NMW87625.1 radical SAM family heme chaperone HemW [Mobiluncus curtisii]
MGSPRTLSAYVHVPYCLRRCGYCDFNTYSNLSLGPGVGGYAAALLREIGLYAPDCSVSVAVCPDGGHKGGGHEGGAGGAGASAGRQDGSHKGGGRQDSRALTSVFFGGGTPTVLPATDLVRVLRGLSETFGLVPGAEITTEANPDTVTPQYLEALAAGGFTRVSFGMQSAVPAVLATLNRTHQQKHLVAGVQAAHSRGLEVSVDLIYGTPGESLADWRASLDAALELGADHVSCYALVIEPGTALGRALAQGDIPPVDPDDQADKYELADETLSAAGLQWYEISNWARPGHECRHNLAYWRDQDWYGFGPGAHSHLGSTRFWNLRHPAKWMQSLQAGYRPVDGREIVTGESARLERLLLNLRLRQGLDLGEYAGEFGVDQAALLSEAHELAQEGLLDGALLPEDATSGDRELAQKDGSLSVGLCSQVDGLSHQDGLLHQDGSATDSLTSNTGRAVLTRRGRLLADTVIQRLAGVS